MSDPKFNRRGSLIRVGGFLATAIGAAGLKIDNSEGAGPAAVASGELACVLTPEQTEGPYYIANEAVRRNITEGRPGAPLLLRAFVVNASTCKPIKGAAVDIWHADAGGVYSGFGSGAGNRTFMRGIQRTNAKASRSFARSIRAGTTDARCTST